LAFQKYSGNLGSAKDGIGTTLDIAIAIKKKEGIWQN
jgi:hypothetical protein